MARIRSSLRKMQAADADDPLVFDDLEIDMVARTVKKNGELLKLTTTEYNLLLLFAKNEGKGAYPSIDAQKNMGHCLSKRNPIHQGLCRPAS
jgi:hypothetical protein